MELFRGKPYWSTTWQPRTYARASTTLACDAAIIGGGISGMLTAYVLARAGHRVVLFERDRLGQGSSSLNTGLIQFMSDDLMTDLAARFSPAVAESFYRASARALDLLENIAGELPQNPQFRRNDSLYVASDSKAMEQLSAEASLQTQAGLPSRLVDRKELAQTHQLKGIGALQTQGDVEINPFQFIHFMAETAADRHDLIILEETPVAESQIDLEGGVITLSDLTCSFGKLIIATGYDVFPFVKKQMPQMELITTFAAITSPLPDHRLIPSDFMVWESARPYLYFRTSADGRLIAGGGDEKNTGLSEPKARRMADRLLDQIRDLLIEPVPLVPEYWYEAIFSESRDGLPYIGPHPDHDNVFVIHGIGGNGTVYSAMGAAQACDFMEKGPDPAYAYLWPGSQRRI